MRLGQRLGWVRGLAVLAAAACGGGGSSTDAGPPVATLVVTPRELVTRVGWIVDIAVEARDAVGAPVPGARVEWRSSAPSVISVDPGGRLDARAPGTATLTATAPGATATARVTVGALHDPAAAPPRFVTRDYIDLSRVERLSRYRSGVGHSFTDGTETCRSMKHYYQPRAGTDWTTVAITAPVDGWIWSIVPDGGRGMRVDIFPTAYPAATVEIFHVTPAAGIARGMMVAAGTPLGTHASQTTMSDVSIRLELAQRGTFRLASYFDVMSDPVFAGYQARGVASRQAAIISKAERDADPLPCTGESQFPTPGRVENWVVLR